MEAAAQRGTGMLSRSRPRGGTVLGPAPAPLALLRGYHRWQALLQGPSSRLLKDWVAPVLEPMRKTADSRGVAMSLVVDPQNTM